jgi:hypothetical protein
MKQRSVNVLRDQMIYNTVAGSTNKTDKMMNVTKNDGTTVLMKVLEMMHSKTFIIERDDA